MHTIPIRVALVLAGAGALAMMAFGPTGQADAPAEPPRNLDVFTDFLVVKQTATIPVHDNPIDELLDLYTRGAR
ncbi:hypothetical protein SEA_PHRAPPUCCINO_96 [Mycobacterium phage Phrappuccino]|uniref:Uncharacterized protein n=1 Tax=Mycobacterium phage Phrappuccino TaxID=2591223 RepID=A0A514DDS6_9CAUD|nr:hypothetical protein KHQ87_gp096 [Mycobacterium phage Phrappuccino]QDH91771.1 hypothetical protein SEA_PHRAPPUCCINO_96 [Mycobacterium phage Phrappuccino]QIQ63213.1 hypothetical protein SEA_SETTECANDELA_96 [Mycobacterium phage Settecandela]